MRHDRQGSKSPARLGDREDGALVRNHYIAGGHDPGAAPEAAAMNQGDDRLRQLRQAKDRIGGAARDGNALLGREAAQRVDPGQIGACLEVTALPADHNNAHVRVFRKGRGTVGQLGYHLGVVGVVPFRPGQPDRCDPALVALDPRHRSRHSHPPIRSQR